MGNDVLILVLVGVDGGAIVDGWFVRRSPDLHSAYQQSRGILRVRIGNSVLYATRSPTTS